MLRVLSAVFGVDFAVLVCPDGDLNSVAGRKLAGNAAEMGLDGAEAQV